MGFPGKFLNPNSVPATALVTAFFNTLLRSDATVNWATTQNAGGQRLTNLGAPSSASDAVRLQDLERIPYKNSVVAATTGNITLTAPQTIDGVSVVAGDRVLVWKQTTQSQNGIYIVAAGAWTRSSDADEAADFNALRVKALKGTTLSDHEFVSNTDDVIVNTTALPFIDLGVGTAAAFPTTANKDMACSTTSADGQAATAVALVSTPAKGSYIEVTVSKGYRASVGDGVKTKDCYFSADAGATAKTIANVVAGDLLYWNGSIAGAQLASGVDTLDYDYVV